MPTPSNSANDASVPQANPPHFSCPSCGCTKFRYATFQQMECDFAPDADEPRVDFGPEGGLDMQAGIYCRNSDCGRNCDDVDGAWEAVEAMEALQGGK